MQEVYDTIADREAVKAADALLREIQIAIHSQDRADRNRAQGNLASFARMAHRAWQDVELQRTWGSWFENSYAPALFPSVEPERQTYGQPGVWQGD